MRIWILGSVPLTNGLTDPAPDPALFVSDLQEAQKKIFLYVSMLVPLILYTAFLPRMELAIVTQKGTVPGTGSWTYTCFCRTVKSITAHSMTELGYTGNVEVVDDSKIF